MAELNLRNMRIGDALKANGLVTEAAIEEAIAFQKTNRGMRMAEILIKLGYITEEVLLDYLAKLLNLRIVNLKQFAVEIDAVSLLPRVIAEKYSIIIISRSDTDVILAVNDPLNYQAIEETRTFVSENIQLVLCYQDEIDNAIALYYNELNTRSTAREVESIQAASEQELDFDLLEDEQETPVVKLVNSLLMKGYSVGATDIHIEPFEGEVLIRLRVDGIISEYLSLDYNIFNSLIARIKIISGMDIAEKRQPQDGNFRYKMGGHSFNIRTSVIPTVYGEKAVLRFLDMKTQIINADHFGMNELNYELAMRILRNPHGIIYIAGATGSGKTTTLYAFLDYLTKRSVSIVSVEDPVERKLRRVAQVQVNPAAGLTFQSGLRSILRQDPDVIMVGETRDEETASISVRAAITGHLVLSTIHTNSAVSTISRLIDMGIPPYMVSSSLTGLISQRLIRMICPLCKVEYNPEADERETVKLPEGKFYKGLGCKDCNHTGYKGRIAAHEILEIDSRVRRMINERADIEDIERYCVQVRGMRLISEEIRRLIAEGITTVSEFVRIASTLD